MKTTLIAITVAATMFASSASVDVVKLWETNECSGCNLNNADLEGVDLVSANLAGSNLESAYMKGTIRYTTIMPDGLVIYSGC